MTNPVIAPSTDRKAAVTAFGAMRASHREEDRVTGLLNAMLTMALEPHTQPLLIGAPGLGKTDLAARVVGDFVVAKGRNAPAYVNVPPAPRKGDEYDLRPVCRHILNGLGRPRELIDAVGSAPWEKERSGQALIDTTKSELAIRQPGVLVLDEFERLFRRGNGGQQPVETIAWWADCAEVPILGIGNYDAVMTQYGSSSKLDRRQPIIHYEPYEGADGFTQYLTAMLPLVKHLKDTGLGATGVDWDPICRLLFTASHGRVGESKRVLALALRISGEKAMTRDCVEEAVAAQLSARVRKQFDHDLEAGRRRLAGTDGGDARAKPAQTREPRSDGPRIGRKPQIVPTGTPLRP